MAGTAESFEEVECGAGLAGGAEPVSDSVAGKDAGAGTALREAGQKKPNSQIRSGHTSGNEGPRSTPEPPSALLHRRTVLAGKVTLTPRRKAARPCLLRAVPHPYRYRDGGSGGNEDRAEVFRKTGEQSYTKYLTLPFDPFFTTKFQGRQP